MALNPELIKLISILTAAIVILGGGFFIQKRYLIKKKLAEEQMYANYNSSSSTLSNDGDFNNETIKNYILQYKGTYPRDSIKIALVNSGNSADEVERYLNKFF